MIHCRHIFFFRRSLTNEGFLFLYLYVCWQCAAECALPDRGVWPPPPRPPVVSSYSSSLSSGAFGSELNGKQVRGRRGRWKEARGFKSNYQVFQMYLYFTSFETIVEGICLLFAVCLFPDLPGSLRWDIWDTGFEGIVSCDCLSCRSLNRWFIWEFVT